MCGREEGYRVSVDVFGHGMHHDVCAVIERVLNVWAEKGVIHHHHDPVLVCDAGYSSYVD